MKKDVIINIFVECKGKSEESHKKTFQKVVEQPLKKGKKGTSFVRTY